jgi:hypothetical protein
MKQIQTFKTKRSNPVGAATCAEAGSRTSRCSPYVDDLLARIEGALRERRLR